MKILIVGGGGREHALAWKLRQSHLVTELYCAPGNAGTGGLGVNVPIGAGDVPALVGFARQKGIEFVVVGPELPLTLGLADRLTAAGIPTFGPTQAAAQLEGSKAFAKDFMARHRIPTAAYAVFQAGREREAKAFAAALPGPWVVKADGLAAGKGVLICATMAETAKAIDDILVRQAFGAAGASLVIEEYLTGQELSLMAFADGKTVALMPPAQDHKRIYDGDQGPNTGGMGAYAPAPAGTPAVVAQAHREILLPAVEAMAAEGRPFQGVLYAGLMLTEKGPVALEFNARFGDPETEAVLPLLEDDLLEIMLACAAGGLERMPQRWREASCATVVMATAGYPAGSQTGDIIRGLDRLPADVTAFHCGTAVDGQGRVVTAGGRALAITAVRPTLAAATAAAYQGVDAVEFAGSQHRRDIARRALTS
ncbi:MAG: phosphoribosylamine--glycine ligase [Peptococcaceae bacterium]|jgi:phosphoribosylamine--glycine ligase|nr:phosphoribosylamine--glycine ligase [Peptococcaceae bacterium]